MGDRVRAFDRFQQRHRWLAFPVAVIKKFADDQAGHLAALIAYYAFVSLFPLLLLSVTVLGFLLQSDPSVQQQIVHSAVSRIPAVGDQLKASSLHGSGVALAVGIGGALFGGMGITQASQSAFNRVWGVPFKARPNFLTSRLRGLGVLALLGAISIASFALTGAVTTALSGAAARVGGYILGAAVNVVLFLTAFRLLTAKSLPWHVDLPGAIVAGVFWQILQSVGSGYAKHVVDKDQKAYGVFGIVLGLLALLYLGAQVSVLSAEVNVVRARRLWPRSLMSPLTSADEQALRQSAETEERVDEENVDVSFT